MKKDIEIPLVTAVYVAAVLEENKEFNTMDWNAYIINSKDIPLEMVLIVSRGFDKEKSTSTMRHAIKVLPPRSFAKIEFMENGILGLENEFLVTFFEENRMQEKKFVFNKNTIKASGLKPVPIMNSQGILAVGL